MDFGILKSMASMVDRGVFVVICRIIHFVVIFRLSLPHSKIDWGGGTRPGASTKSPEASVQGLGGGTNPEASKTLKW